jgi:starch synthase (maltosyl-transferring)
LLIDGAAARADKNAANALRRWAELMRRRDDAAWELAGTQADELGQLMARYPDLRYATQYERDLVVLVEREKAGFSAWYELFPRSCGRAAARMDARRLRSALALRRVDGVRHALSPAAASDWPQPS